MHRFKGLLFDIDGTLTSTNELIFASFNHITGKHMNKIMTPEEIIMLFGPTEDKIIEDWFGDEHEKVKKDYYDFYRENHNMAALYPGMYDLLKLVSDAGFRLGTFTGKGRKAALITLEQCGIKDFFEIIISGDDVVKHKPDSEGIRKFIEFTGLQHEDVLMIGDAPADIISARGCGVQVASVLWDSYAAEKVISLQPDYIFHSVAELQKFLLLPQKEFAPVNN